MKRSDYFYYRGMFDSFGREVLEEFKKQLEQGLEIHEGKSKHELDTVVKSTVKCFVLYIKAKEESLSDR